MFYLFFVPVQSNGEIRYKNSFLLFMVIIISRIMFLLYSLAKKWQVQSLFSMSVPWDAPELLIPNDMLPVYTNVVEEVSGPFVHF